MLESKDVKDAKRAYRQKCEGFITEDGLLFKTKRRKKGLTYVQKEERYRVVTVDEKVRLLTLFTKIQQAVTLEFIKRMLYYTL